MDMPDVDQFMFQNNHSLEHRPTQLSLTTTVFGSKPSPEYFRAWNAVIEGLQSIVGKEFLSDSGSTAALERGQVVEKMLNLVTFTDKKDDLQVWERAANVRRVGDGAVEADLLNLFRDFGTTVAMPVLYGKDFLERNPTFLEDFWRFDNDLFPLLMVGIPTWAPFKMMREGLASRTRILTALEGLYRRIDQYQNNEPVNFGADMSDVGIATGRNSIYREHNLSFSLRGDIDFSFLWGQNGNSQPLLSWYILFAYSTPGLVERYREEMAPWVKVSQKKGPVEIESVDIAALNRECPLMKSALYETFRLGAEATSIRRVSQPISVVDGEYTHQLEPGTWISVPYGVTQNDPSIYPDPERFVPERFLELDVETGKKVARYGRLRPWAVGAGSCKGRTFAEKEILTIAATAMNLWEIEPVIGKWEIPDMIPGVGAKRPVNDIRVTLRRRVLS